jgi:hypothetical protein
MPATGPNFLIGVFSQPISSFQKWKSRGINTLVSHEPEGGRIRKADWEAAAAAAGFWFMDYPADDDAILQNEAKQPQRIAFMQDDEPDMTRQPSTDRTNADGWTKPELLAARYARCKAAAPNLPVFVNFAGTAVTPDAYPGNKHLPYLAAADWIAHDWYVKNKNWQRYPTSLIGKAMDRLALWSASTSSGQTGGKPQFVFIECSDQKISPLGRIPTPDEVEEEVNLAVSKGANGIIYFPQRPPPGFQYDAMPPEIVDRIVQINTRLAGTPDVHPELPTTAQLVDQINQLSARCDVLSKDVETLKARKYRVLLDVEPVDR